MRLFGRFLDSKFRMKFFLVAVVFLEMADALMTHFLVTSGAGREGNPFLQEFVGEEKFFILKMAGGLLAAFLLWDIYRRWPKLATISTSCLLVALTAVVGWNVYAYFVTL